MFGAVCLLCFFCSLFTPYAHAMGFPAYFSAPTPSFLSATYRLASGVGFSACFSSPTPTPWVSPPAFLLPRPVSSPQHIDKLPGWVFSPAFHSLRPRYGFSRPLFTPFAHDMGFPAYFSAHSPSFRSATYRLASGVGFLARFSLPSPTLWVFPPTFSLTRPSHYIHQKKL